MATLITTNDLAKAAATLGCEMAAIRAVDEVESNGSGFKNGKIVLRFETAVFRKYTGTTISGSGQSAFDKAYKASPHYALLSTSWGRYQIMGFNYDICGYKSVEAFVTAMKTGEQAHLDAFIAFVIARQLADELKSHDWAGFARVYNGTNYAQNSYHTKLAKAYEKYKNQPSLTVKQITSIDKTLVWVLTGVAAIMVMTYFLVRSYRSPQLQTT